MFRKVCSVLLISLMLLGTVGFAESVPATNENVVFTYKASGDVVESYTTAEAIVAKTLYYNTTDSDKNPILVVCSYNEGGELNNVWYNTVNVTVAANSQATVSVEFTPTVGNTIKATLVDGLKTTALKPMTKEAKMTEDSTDLASITVNGERLADFSNEKNEYLIQSDDKFEVLAEAKDGSTKVDVKMPDSIPGTAQIDVTSATGTSKKVYVTCYEEESQLLALKELKFNVNGQSYSIPNFDLNTLEYTVNINDVTENADAKYLYTTVEPVAVATSSIIEVKVENTNIENPQFGVDPNAPKYYYVGGADYRYRKQFEQRKAVDNVIPIKNGQATAIINVARTEGGSQTYKVNFTAKQPQLLAYNLNAEGPKMPFIGGAAVNNDNGSNVVIDRNIVMSNVSKNLIGASLIPGAYAVSGNAWWNSINPNQTPYEPTEYFNFTADTAGKVIVMLYNNGPKAYTDPTYGWTKVSSAIPTVDSNGQTLVINGKDVTYNDYPAGTYYVGSQSLGDNDDRFGAKLQNVSLANQYCIAYEKSFNANESVSVPVWSTGDGNSDRLGIVMIKWNLD